VKVFAEHVGQSVFPALRAHYPHGAFVHVRRRNYLDVLISREIASRSARWVDWSHEPETSVEVEPFEIPVADAMAFFTAMRENDAYFASYFAGPGYYVIDYEDLVADLPGQAAALFSFLGLPDCDVTAVTRKQVGADQWALVRNADELRDAWAEFAQLHGIAAEEAHFPA